MLRKFGTHLSFLTMHTERDVAFVVSSTLSGCSRSPLYTQLQAENEEGDIYQSFIPYIYLYHSYASITWINWIV